MKTAFFDFDDTLTQGDTLPLWLAACVGWPRTLFAYAIATTIGGLIPAPGAFDWRGRVKALLLRLAIRGIDAGHAASALAPTKITWRIDTIAKLKAHAAEGHHVVVVTGAATVYVPALLAGLPINEIIGTKLEMLEGRLTGRIEGQNCVRAAKAELVRDWIAQHQPEETWGYGNDPHDLPMLALLDHQTII